MSNMSDLALAVDDYVAWCRDRDDANPDTVATLKAYQREEHMSAKHADYIADQLYLGGGESDWRSHSYRDEV
jgi:hypothetical protein